MRHTASEITVNETFDEFINELAQKTNANSLKKEKKVNSLKICPQVEYQVWILKEIHLVLDFVWKLF